MTKKLLLTTILACFAAAISFAQNLSGLVLDDEGNPLAFTTIFIKETGSGSISNEAGKYELRLDPGTYNIIFQHLGYQTQKLNVTVTNAKQRRDVVMVKQAYLLQEAEIDGGKEDPSYPVIRKAQAKSAYHRQQVEKYTCEVYLKGGGRLVSVPWFLESALEEEGIDTSATFVTESISEITYTRPNNYEEKVISIRTSGDSRNTSPMNYVNGSFYDPKVGGLVSPLAPNAFAYYKFRHIRTFEDQGFQINEIKVMPRSRGEDVVSGYIYIVEDLWCIHSLDFSSQVQGIKVDFKQIFTPVREAVWMPVSHQFDGSGKILGVAFEFQYLATVSKYDVELNTDLATDFVLLDEKSEKDEIEARDEKLEIAVPDMSETEEKLVNGDEVTRKELRKLLREYEKESRKEKEEPTVMETRKMSIDSLAYKSDSAYWAEKRPIALTTREVKGYAVQDSMVAAQEAKAIGDTLDIGEKGFKASHLLLGNRYNLGKDNYLELKPLWTGINFNTVDGWNGEVRMEYFKRFDSNRRLRISPAARYGFSREKFMAKVDGEYRYGSGLKKGVIEASGGSYYSQFNPKNPLDPFLNTFISLFNERNYMKVYDKNWGEVEWRHMVRHNVTLAVRSSYTERIETFNSTSQVWTKHDHRSYTANAPENVELASTSFDRSTAFKARIALDIRPGARYRKSEDNYYRVNRPPRLVLAYEKAIPGVADAFIDYDLATASLEHRFDFNLFGKFGFKTTAGKFLRDDRMDFTDFAHFQGNQTALTRNGQMKGYAMLPYYALSTGDEFWSTYLNYEFRQFLFTNITALRLTGVKENINVNHLITPSVQNYLEVGYSVDNIFRFLRFDLTASFIDGKYEDFQFQIGITSDMLTFD